MLTTTHSQPSLNFSSFASPSDILSSTDPYIKDLFNVPDPSNPLADLPPELIFSTDRSLSLYSQLVAPPPLAPPNWIRSRIRRMFLISLGVPVDLDELLPPKRMGKLVLPYITPTNESGAGQRSRQPSIDDRGGGGGGGAAGALDRVKREGENDSTTSVNTTASGTKKSRRPHTSSSTTTSRNQRPSEPPFDIPAVRRLCGTTTEALQRYADEELRQHRLRLEACIEEAAAVLEYWEKRLVAVREEKEAFEGVIGNLVRHARAGRK